MCVAAFPKTQASTSLVRKGRNGVTHTSIRNRAGGNNWNMSAAQLDEAFYHLSLPCMSRILSGRNVLHCLRACKGVVGLSLIFLLFSLFAFLFLFGATPIPYRIIMSFLLFVSLTLVWFSFSEAFDSDFFLFLFSIFLSLMHTLQRIG